jgi:hypothetical protein
MRTAAITASRRARPEPHIETARLGETGTTSVDSPGASGITPIVQLTIVEDSSAAPPVPDVADPSATVWREESGTIIAIGKTTGDRHWVHVPRLGAFSFPREHGGITAVPQTGADPGLIEDAFRRMVMPLALQAQGREVLHASAVRADDGVLALCATSGTGKSTIARGLSGRGHPLWADDAVCFETSDSTVEALPLPFTLRLRPASAAFFADDSALGEPRSPSERERLARVFVMERSGSGAPRIERLTAADAFREVLTHGYCFSMHDKARNEAMVRNYLDLVVHVPVYRVAFSEGLDRLGETLDAIEAAA